MTTGNKGVPCATQSSAYSEINAAGKAGITLLCEHASNHFPPEFNDLGLEQDAKDSHAAWDPGASAVALKLSQILDAPLVLGGVSRLVYDLNRTPDSEDAMRSESERYHIPGNVNLSDEDKALRIDGIYHPFHNAVEQLMDARAANGVSDVLVTIHSFNPEYNGEIRPVELGFMDDNDTRLGDWMLAFAPKFIDMSVQRNYPYGPKDNCMHTAERHGRDRGIPHVMIEIRNDLIQTDEQIDRLSQNLGALIAAAALEVGADTLDICCSRSRNNTKNDKQKVD